MTFEEALEKAKKRNPKFNVCTEHPNAWSFAYDDGEEYTGGPNTGIVYMKEDGKMLMPYEYYMSEVGSSEIISEQRF